METPKENTETVTVVKEGDRYQITVQHDLSGSAYGIPLSDSAYEQLLQYFVTVNENRKIEFEEQVSKNLRKFYPPKNKIIY